MTTTAPAPTARHVRRSLAFDVADAPHLQLNDRQRISPFRVQVHDHGDRSHAKVVGRLERTGAVRTITYSLHGPAEHTRGELVPVWLIVLLRQAGYAGPIR